MSRPFSSHELVLGRCVALFCILVFTCIAWRTDSSTGGTTTTTITTSAEGDGRAISAQQQRNESSYYHEQRRRQQYKKSFEATTTTTTTPVIGIFAWPSHDNKYYDYIASSYVKWLEVGGARSIAIPFDASAAYLDDLFTQIHGLLLPGGAGTSQGPPPRTVQYMLNKAMIRHNNRGVGGHYFFPVWGTCLGFEYLIRHVAQCTAVSSASCPLQSGFDAENISLPLEQVVPWQLYQDDAVRNVVSTQNVTMNNHEMAVSVDDFDDAAFSKLTEVWKVTSINHDRQGRAFVSTIEPKHPNSFPVYGVQYHPEKNAFEYATYPNTDIPYEAINHSPDAIEFSIDLARFLVNLTRRSVLANPTHVYNQTDRFPPVYTYPTRAGKAFEEVHIIPKRRREYGSKHQTQTPAGQADENNNSSSSVVVGRNVVAATARIGSATST